MKKLACVAAALSLAAVPAMADSFGMRIADDTVSVGVAFGAPPAPIAVVPPAGAVWAPGYWAWNGFRYLWVEGHWERPAPIYGTSYLYAQPEVRWYFGGHDHWREHREEHHRHGGWRDR